MANGYGDGYGAGYGDGYGYGAGYGAGYGDGYGAGYGYGSGSGDGDGYGSGSGSGDGYGSGSGDGSGSGSGSGDGYGYGSGEVHVDGALPIKAWHYAASDGRLRFDRTDCAVTVGLVLEHEGEIELCRSGLHASLTVEQARSIARELKGGAGVLCRVACSGRVKMGSDKLVCTRREVIAIYPDGVVPSEELDLP